MLKKALKKLDESTAAKFIAAVIVPGGFIFWSAYELGKKRQQQDEADKRGSDGQSDDDASKP